MNAKTLNHSRRANFILIISGTLPILLGLTVLIGWYTHNPTLIQVLPNLVPMQYNTALAFLLGGAGLLLNQYKRPRLSLACGGIVLLLGLLTLFQYIFWLDFGIDQLFMEHYITVATSHPGRMAPNTALSFMLTGIILAAINPILRLKKRSRVVGILGSVLLALGVVALFGYISGVETSYGWGNLTRMAVHTSIGFIIFGVGILAWAWRYDEIEATRTPRWHPVLAGVCMATISILMWQAFVARQNEHIKLDLQTTAEDTKGLLSAQLDARIATLDRLAERWEYQGGISHDQWVFDVNDILSDQPGYQAIEWVDQDYTVRWVEPLEGNQAAKDLNLAFDEARKTALEAARASGDITVTSTIDLVQGGKGFLVYVPLFPDGEFDGFILGVFHIENLLDTVLPGDRLKEYALAFDDGREEIYHRDEAHRQYADSWLQETDYDFYGISWHMRIWPAADHLTNQKSFLPEVVLIFGLLMAFFFALLVYFGQTSNLRSQEIEAANRSLSQEVVERVKAETQLRESEAKYRNLIEHIPQKIFYKNKQSVYLAVNPSYAADFNLQPADFEGKNDHDFFSEELANKYRADDQRIMQAAQIEELDEKDGQGRTVHTVKAPIMGDSGQCEGVLGIFWDITERMQAEQALQQAKNQLNLILESAGEGIYGLDLEGKTTFVNQVALQMLGYSLEETVGQSQHALVHHSHPDGTPYARQDCPIYAAFTDGQVRSVEDEVFWRKDGSCFPVEYTSTPIWNGDDIAGAVVTFKDITNRKQAEGRIRQQNAILETINRVFRETLASETEDEVAAICLEAAEKLTASQFGYIGELNAAGLFDTKAISNPGWEACTIPETDTLILVQNMAIRGIDRTMLNSEGSRIVNDPASHPDSVGVPEGHPPVECFLGVPLKQGRQTIGMIGLANKAGGYSLDDQSAVESLAGTCVEVLNRKRIEDQVEAYNVQLESSNRDLQEFAYVASHDLQEPLRKIMAFGDRLATHNMDDLDDKGRDYIERMSSASQRMQVLINALLTFSRIETRAQPFTLVDMPEVAAAVVSDLELQIERTGGRVEIGDLPVIEADDTQMRQLLQNLLGNALKYHRSDAPPLVKIWSQSGDGRKGRMQKSWVQLIVEDNGIGFDPQQSERIFKPFQRLHGRGEYEGSGMGLAICRRIVERHGGKIATQSQPGQGTAFIVTLPVKQGK
jgi:PAS domain S-box-containing protein